MKTGRANALAQEMLVKYYEKAFEDGYQKALLKPAPEGSYTYKQGYENGRRDQKLETFCDDDDVDFAIRAARLEGRNDAWECARKAMLEMSNEELFKIFKVNRWQDIFEKYDGAEAVRYYNEWKWEKNNK